MSPWQFCDVLCDGSCEVIWISCHVGHFKALFRSEVLQVQDFTGERWYVVGGNHAGEPHVNGVFSSSCSGVLVPGGFGVRGTEGKIQAISWARKQKKPFLGEKRVSSMRRNKEKKEVE